MSYDALINAGEYFSAHYLAEVFPRELRRTVLPGWAAQDKAAADKGLPPTSPRARLRALRQRHFSLRVALADPTADGLQFADPAWRKRLDELHDAVGNALGFTPTRRLETVEHSGTEHEVPILYGDGQVVAIGCGWATEADAALDSNAAGQLPEPVTLGAGKALTTGSELASFLFGVEEPPRYVLILVGAVVILADRHGWGEGRYLAANLDSAFGRNDTTQAGELDTIAALFSAESLLSPEEGGANPLATLVDASHRHAIGVSAELRTGLRRSVELIANEVLARLREAGVTPEQFDDPKELAARLARESLRYLYRILFLLYAEARPDLGILPADYPEYAEGYGLGRLGELVVQPMVDESARGGFHLYESLALLFDLVNRGHRPRQVGGDGSEGEGIRFEPLHSDLFAAGSVTLIGRPDHPDWDAGNGDPDEQRRLDTRLRNGCLRSVLRLLMLARGRGKERGGFISYAQLSINHLGELYEGLMAYTGSIATEELYEVAKGGDASGGSWTIPATAADSYPDAVFVQQQDEETGDKRRLRYPPGSFVYRLAGRDRQTSASYYTPESLTKVTVQLALKQRLTEHGEVAAARDLLDWTICEPALGSGAFLNEAINQVAAEYLRRRQDELGEIIDPGTYETELRKVKAYVALHNSYGVDLNPTAVELAEVSLWLNVMHPGLQAPWFGMHLRRGNSLIGAGRRYYAAGELPKGQWLAGKDTLPPTDHPFRAGELPAGAVHHFLLPALGWAAVVGEKEARELAPDDTKRLATWRKSLLRKPKGKQLNRLRDLARRTEYLWQLVIRRLEISQREISRHIDVWGAADLPHPTQAVPRQKVYDDLHAAGTPYWRLKTLMDTWCALWFWPVQQADLLDGTASAYPPAPAAPIKATPSAAAATGAGAAAQISLSGEPDDAPAARTSKATSSRGIGRPLRRRTTIPLADVDDWLDFAEALIGAADIPPDSIPAEVTSLHELDAVEEQLPGWMGADEPLLLATRFPWLTVADQITREQGFFHWELDFAHIFASPAAGFDLQLGNPPWVRPDWDEKLVLAERDPWFALDEKPTTDTWRLRKGAVLQDHESRDYIVSQLTGNAGLVEMLSSSAMNPLMAGTRPDLYRVFMSRFWNHLGIHGVVGALHPDTHLVGVKDGHLRGAAYRHLRVHGSFVNAANWAFSDRGRTLEFGIHIYGPSKGIDFVHVSQLYGATVLPESLEHDGLGDPPGQKLAGKWDVRPHRSRVIRVTKELLREWHELNDVPDLPVSETPLLYPITSYEQAGISALASFGSRLGEGCPQISSGYNEKTSKDRGLIAWAPVQPSSLEEVILQGTHFGISTPFAKQPNDPFRFGKDWVAWDLRTLPEDAVPRAIYARACDRARFDAAQDVWNGKQYTEYYRLAWRAMIDPKSTERSLFAAIIPPGPTHVHTVQSMALQTNTETVMSAGFWATLPLDYLLRVTGRSHLQVAEAHRMPAPESGHSLADALLLRTLRLNCLTTAYAPLWVELFDAEWAAGEGWAVEWPRLAPLEAVGENWKWGTPLRTEYERRAALVESDALVAVWLGIGAEELIAIYKSRYPILADRESEMYFDTDGRRIANDPYAFGYGQVKEHYAQVVAHLDEGEPAPQGYRPPFYKADRVAEMRAAHAVFSARLASAGEGRG